MYRVRRNWTPRRPARVVLRRAQKPARDYRRPVFPVRLTSTHSLGKGIRVFRHLLHQLPSFGPVHLAHEVAHLTVLFDQLIDVPDLDACSSGNTLASQSVDDLWILSLLDRH